MWEHYRKTFIRMQIGIVIICCFLILKVKMPLPGVAVYLAVMEVAALIGAMWGARLRRRIQESRDRMPLLPK